MVNVITRKSRHIHSGQELKDLQQPLNYKTGWSNTEFDKNFPESKNPFHGTERDIKNRKGLKFVSDRKICQECGEEAEFISTINGALEYAYCRKCYGKKERN